MVGVAIAIVLAFSAPSHDRRLIPAVVSSICVYSSAGL